MSGNCAKETLSSVTPVTAATTASCKVQHAGVWQTGWYPPRNELDQMDRVVGKPLTIVVGMTVAMWALVYLIGATGQYKPQMGLLQQSPLVALPRASNEAPRH